MISQISRLTLLIGLCSIAPALQAAPEDACETFLLPNEFIGLQRWMKHHFKQYDHFASMDFERALALTVEPENTGKNAISFGAGADLYSPLINFPLAENIHLVDLWTGWGQGSGEVLREIIRRAAAIHPTAQVKIRSMGFLDFAPTAVREAFTDLVDSNGVAEFSDELLRFTFLRSEYPGRDELLQRGPGMPFVLEVRWLREDLLEDGKSVEVRRKIFLHIADFNDPSDLAALDQTLAENGGSLAGLVVTGISWPEALSSYINHLSPHGSAVLETFSDFPDLAKIEELRLNPALEVQHAALRTMIRWGQSHPVQQSLWVIKKRQQE